MFHKTLALAIPAYNRAAILEDNLLSVRATLEELDVAVHVLDDSSNDDTAAAVARLATTTQLRIVYQRNLPPLRHDANLLHALAAPQTDFVWLLGDASKLDGPGLRAVHARLGAQDFIFVNARGGAAPNTIDHLGDDELREFMCHRAWDLSYTGATLYSRRVIDWWRADLGHRPRRNFPQLSVILGFLATGRHVTASWIGTHIVGSHPRKTESYWLGDALNVWGADWHAVIKANAAAFGGRAIGPVLQSHARNTGILSAQHLLVLRAAGRFHLRALLADRKQLQACCTVGRIGLALIAALPQAAAVAIVKARPKWQRRFMPGGVRELQSILF